MRRFSLSERDTNPPTLALINTLPNELLEHIFVLCVLLEVWHEDSSWALRHTLNPNAPPWSLTLVCRRWYNLALSCPALWATLVAPYSYPNELEERLWRVQISRSADSALYIQARSTVGTSWGSWEDFISAISQRCKQLDLWNSVCVELPPTFQSFPQLEVLCCPARLIRTQLRPIHETLPRLRSLSIQGRHSGQDARQLPALSVHTPLPNLTLSEFKYDATLPLLHSTKSGLHSLHLRDITHDLEFEPAPEPISFPQLRHLSLHRVHKAVVDALDCPRLEELTVLDHMPFHPWTQPFHLTITSANLPWSVNMSHTPLLNCIGSANQLVSLRLKVLESPDSRSFGLQRTEELFEVLSNPTMCPKLAQFSIDCLPFHPRVLHQIMAFVRLVRSRASTLSYAFYAAMENDDDAGWSGLVASDGVTADGVLKEMEDLRVLYPQLDLHVKLRSTIKIGKIGG